jgi:DNA-binding response OmpR family regulator
MKNRILYIEDEPFLGKIVSETLEFRGFEVMLQAEGSGVLQHLQNFKPDICLLDVMLPNVDGYSLGIQIRKMLPQVPIIFLTAKTQTEDVLKGFESGGTDYVRKPFSVDELVARIHNQLSLVNSTPSRSGAPGEIVQLGTFRFSPGLNELSGHDRTIRLSYRESQVLLYLSSHLNSVSDRKDLLLAVWGDDSFFNSRNLDVYIRKLREYFTSSEGVEIITLKGKGYYFKVKD